MHTNINTVGNLNCRLKNTLSESAANADFVIVILYSGKEK